MQFPIGGHLVSKVSLQLFLYEGAEVTSLIQKRKDILPLLKLDAIDSCSILTDLPKMGVVYPQDATKDHLNDDTV